VFTKSTKPNMASPARIAGPRSKPSSQMHTAPVAIPQRTAPMLLPKGRIGSSFPPNRGSYPERLFCDRFGMTRNAIALNQYTPGVGTDVNRSDLVSFARRLNGVVLNPNVVSVSPYVETV